MKMLERALWNRVPFGKFNRTSAFPVRRRRSAGLASELQENGISFLHYGSDQTGLDLVEAKRKSRYRAWEERQYLRAATKGVGRFLPPKWRVVLAPRPYLSGHLESKRHDLRR